MVRVFKVTQVAELSTYSSQPLFLLLLLAAFGLGKHIKHKIALKYKTARKHVCVLKVLVNFFYKMYKRHLFAAFPLLVSKYMPYLRYIYCYNGLRVIMIYIYVSYN